LDAKANEEITPKVLTQILLQYEPVKLHMFSNELLTRAIRVNDRLLKDFVDVYFRQAFEAFCGSQKQLDQMLPQAHHLTSILPAVASSAANLLPAWMPLSARLPSAPAPASESNESRLRWSTKRDGSVSRRGFETEGTNQTPQFVAAQKAKEVAHAREPPSQQGQECRPGSGRTSETRCVDYPCAVASNFPNRFSTPILWCKRRNMPAHARASGLQPGGPALRTAAPRVHRTLSLLRHR
jgi:hypothetical protein